MSAAKKPTSRKSATTKKATAARSRSTKGTVRKVGAPTKKGATVERAKIREGRISSWNPSSGRGLIKVDTSEIPFDVMRDELTNEGYVDLHVGRGMSVVTTGDAVQSVTALAE